jgi:hypothetical protein
MDEQYNIRYINHTEIDKIKWDNRITHSANGLIYAYSFYLDNMTDEWDALVLNDYEAIMPLTWKKKYSIRYLYQPFLTAQLGVFGNNLSARILELFVKQIPSDFKYWDFYLNHQNVFPVSGSGINLYLRSNYVLDLSKSYEVLNTGYRENIKRNIKKCTQLGCRAEKGFEAEKVIDLALQQMRVRNRETDQNISRFRKLYKLLQAKAMATTYGIFSAQDELLASAIFFYSHNRAYYILVGNHPNGKTMGASHALIDAFIKDHAGQKMLLDFEGSDIRNLAFFYSSFGALEEKYTAIRLNRLPFYLKWLKK